MTHFPHPEYDESTASSEDERPVLDCRFGPEYRQGPLKRAFARHWPGWRYAGFLTSIFLLLVATATAGALTFSSLVRSGSAAVADHALIPPTLGGNTSPADPLAT